MNAKQPPVDKTKTPAKVQGEGDYESSRRFREDEENFLKKADVPELARRAAPQSKEEAAELEKAEEVGRSHRADTKGSPAK
ncbi:MAG TPA: hypothetical protein VHW25_00730 [Steroidobacteraceae bacterium]|jgi:hypothetical protein|nr:hypothetical protein [Steroidobacteraceae bacterium]